MDKFQVLVLEGTREDDIATYYTEDEPIIVSTTIEGEPDIQGVFVSFVPRNGSPNRIGKVNLVPADRIIAIIEPLPEPEPAPEN
jgi:hypothetical protein